MQESIVQIFTVREPCFLSLVVEVDLRYFSFFSSQDCENIIEVYQPIH